MQYLLSVAIQKQVEKKKCSAILIDEGELRSLLVQCLLYASRNKLGYNDSENEAIKNCYNLLTSDVPDSDTFLRNYSEWVRKEQEKINKIYHGTNRKINQSARKSKQPGT